jgi:uncharacterized repeat protein (TIGR02543 family)
VAQQLQANTFTRTGCTFAGWAENKNGTPPILTAGTSIPGKAAGTTLTFYAQWTVTNATDVVTAATNQSGDTITLTGVAWSAGLTTALESALSGGSITTLDLAGVSGLAAWKNDTLLDSNKDKITSLTLPDTVETLTGGEINDALFKGYSNLTLVRGKGVTNIGDYAFLGRVALTDLYLPAAPPTLGANVFQSTNSGTLEIHVGSGNGNIGAYTAQWSTDRSIPVDAETAANGNTTAYGSNHKAINIVN